MTIIQSIEYPNEDNIYYKTKYKIFSRYPLVLISSGQRILDLKHCDVNFCNGCNGCLCTNGDFIEKRNHCCRCGCDREFFSFKFIEDLLVDDEYLISEIESRYDHTLHNYKYFLFTNKRCLSVLDGGFIEKKEGWENSIISSDNTIKLSKINDEYTIEYFLRYNKDKKELLIINKKIFKKLFFPQGSDQMYGPKPYIPNPEIFNKIIEMPLLTYVIPVSVINIIKSFTMRNNNILLDDIVKSIEKYHLIQQKKDLELEKEIEYKYAEEKKESEKEIKKELQIHYQLKEKELEEKYKQKHIELEKYYVKREQQISSLLINKLEKEMIELIKQEI
jgi:hypothetical protein